MLKNFSEQLKAGYAQEKLKQQQIAQQPTAPASRSYFRKMGAMLFGLGCLAALVNGIAYWMVGRTLIIMLAIMLGMWGIGIWMMLSGKSIKRP